MQVKFTNKQDGSESVPYNVPDFPAYIFQGIMSSFPDFSAMSHWHDDIELILVQSGEMQYNVNGSVVTLQEGEGIFVNTRQLHYGFSQKQEEILFLGVLFHPVLLCSVPRVEQSYIVPVIENKAMPYRILHPDQAHESDILALLAQMSQCSHDKLFEIKMQSLFFQIWEHLFLLSDHTEQRLMPRNEHLSILQDMLCFIYRHYTEKISLAQISQAGGVGKTTSCAIFQKYTNETPISYLTNYRLKRSIELLEETDQTITEICFAVGFSGPSYFTETFRKVYGCAPTQYRARHCAHKREKDLRFFSGG